MTAEDARPDMRPAVGLKIVVVGATGNVGTCVVRTLGADPRVESVVGAARRIPRWTAPKTRWESIDVVDGDLVSLFRGADAVVHLAWLFQPTHDPEVTWRTNVLGSIRVFDAVAQAGAATLVHASSIGAYSPAPDDHDRPVDESWPTHGWPGAAYTREKAYLERVLDLYEREHPEVRVVRLRPAFIFQREAAVEQSRLLAGPLLSGAFGRLARPSTLPAVVDLPGLRYQAVHGDDVAEAYRLAVLRPAHGAFNIAADPVVDARMLSELLNAKVVSLPLRPVRAAVAAAWNLRLLPASPGLFDAVMHLPVMDTTRARTELAWQPIHDARAAIEAFLTGLRESAGLDTPPLSA